MARRKIKNEYEDYLNTMHSNDIKNISDGAKLPYEIIIDYSELKNHNPKLAELLIIKSDDCIIIFKNAVRNINRNNPDINKLDTDDICNIRFKNLSEITPIRELTAENIGKLIQTTGIINNYTINHQVKIKTASFECRGCARIETIEQDSMNLKEPSLCSECGGRNFKLLEEQSKFINMKYLTITENIDEMGGKTKPQPINAIITGEREFIEKINQGTGKINIVGKLVSNKDKENWNTFLVINNLWYDENKSIKLTSDEIKEFESLKDGKTDIIDILINSFAQDIFFNNKEPVMLNDVIKLSLLCQRVGAGYMGGNRENINICIVGDKGKGKTQLSIRAGNLYEICKRASGTGATGVGLIGAVDRDTINGGWTYEAGKVILADGGLAVIDEFDKINIDDQPRVNDILQDGITEIDKATVHIQVKSDVSGLALANPIGGEFDLYEDICNQINIDDTTLDRFDGIFIITSKDIDNEIHKKIRMKKYEKYNQESDNSDANNELWDSNKLKKYLSYVENINPIFGEKAKQRGLQYHENIIHSEFNGERQSDSLDRFSSAIAKLRQHEEVSIDDVDKAYQIIYSMALQMGLRISELVDEVEN